MYMLKVKRIMMSLLHHVQLQEKTLLVRQVERREVVRKTKALEEEEVVGGRRKERKIKERNRLLSRKLLL